MSDRAELNRWSRARFNLLKMKDWAVFFEPLASSIRPPEP
jgi:hypothetical protein